MKKIFLVAFAIAFLTSTAAFAGEWNFEVFGKAKALYGYSHFNSYYAEDRSHNHFPSRFSANTIAQYIFNESYNIGLYADLNYGIDQQLKDYNHGSWGEEVYGIFESPYGKFILGQSYNAANQLGISAPSIGLLNVNQSDIVNFIANPNWQRNRLSSGYRTLNSTDINTDGTALKVTYISPEFGDGTMFGFSYIPDSYSRDGLINRYAEYKNKDGYVAAISHAQDIYGFTVSGSLGAAYFEDNDKETSLGLNIYRKGWTVGGGLRKTWVNHHDARMNQPIRKSIEFFDGYRNAWAYNAGISYEFGPFKTALTYFYSQTTGKKYQDEIIQFSNSYQFNKYLSLYAALAHAEFNGSIADEDNRGYAAIIGAGVKF